MAATINGRRVLASESILFMGNETVTFTGLELPIKARIEEINVPAGIDVEWDGSAFNIVLRGFTATDHDNVSHGTGALNGSEFHWRARGQRVAAFTAGPIYNLDFTFVQV